ncbi:hypothetical protein [Paenibacillus sp. MSJ-34]|uniref:hypothetical protein n=1 Tax=Paenibacillus sp. MSJ-34 TaxID=2841529 RepID=UPI001C10471E|nr:hypothetical protein [Paenibacillus sp. MSJ-34]MBU5442139.1 hypothetical protein [Paenibacillus sp. MSJ-34]
MTTWKTALHFPYIGSGPYCYTNSIAMMLGERSPQTAVIEFATSSPFGMQLIGGTLPFFSHRGGYIRSLSALGQKKSLQRIASIPIKEKQMTREGEYILSYR